jgi:hypothetical protein
MDRWKALRITVLPRRAVVGESGAKSQYQSWFNAEQLPRTAHAL